MGGATAHFPARGSPSHNPPQLFLSHVVRFEDACRALQQVSIRIGPADGLAQSLLQVLLRVQAREHGPQHAWSNNLFWLY